MVCTLAGMAKVFICSSAKANIPMYVNPSGSWIDVIEQLEKAVLSILVRVDGRFTVVRLVQSTNAHSLMVVIPSLNVMDSIGASINAQESTPITGLPLTLLGIVISFCVQVPRENTHKQPS